MNREDVLKAKSLKVQAALSRWAVGRGLLGPGEFIQVTAVIEKRSPVSVSISAPTAVRSGRRAVLNDKRFSINDWLRIRSVEFTIQQRAVFEKLRKNGNNPVSTNGLSSASVMSDMNRRIRQAELPYRISETTRGGSWHDKELKFYHVVSK